MLEKEDACRETGMAGGCTRELGLKRKKRMKESYGAYWKTNIKTKRDRERLGGHWKGKREEKLRIKIESTG